MPNEHPAYDAAVALLGADVVPYFDRIRETMKELPKNIAHANLLAELFKHQEPCIFARDYRRFIVNNTDDANRIIRECLIEMYKEVKRGN